MSSSSSRAGLRLLASIAKPSQISSTSQCFSSRGSTRVIRPSTLRATAACFSTSSPRHQQSPIPTPPTDRASANVQRVQHELSPSDESAPTRSLTGGLADPLPDLLSSSEGSEQVDWTRSYHGLSSTPFTPEQAAILMEPLSYDDIEIKPDGIVYLPEIKYRRILNRAFGPGGWGLAPRGETIVTGKVVTREYGLVCAGRLVSIARGEQQYFDPDGIPTATEGCKSNAMMRCCKDLGVASELWDPRFIKRFLAEMGRETMVEHQTTKRRRKHFMRKDDEVRWPLKDVGTTPAAAAPAAPAPAAAKPAAATPTSSAAKPAAATARPTYTPRPAAAAATKR